MMLRGSPLTSGTRWDRDSSRCGPKQAIRPGSCSIKLNVVLSTLILSGALMAASPDSTSQPLTVEDDSLQTVTPSTPAPEPPPRRHRSIPSRTGHAVVNFGSDTWYVVSSPARLNRYSAVQAGLVLGATAVLYKYDQDIWNAAQRNADDPNFQTVENVGGAVEPLRVHAPRVHGGRRDLARRRGDRHRAATRGPGAARRVAPDRRRHSQRPQAGGGAEAPVRRRGFTRVRRRRLVPSGHTSVAFEIATIVSMHAHSAPVTVVLYLARPPRSRCSACRPALTGPRIVLLPAVTGPRSPRPWCVATRTARA